jgi:hypothetical protein
VYPPDALAYDFPVPTSDRHWLIRFLNKLSKGRILRDLISIIGPVCLICGGIALAEWKEWRVACAVSAEPIEVDLAALETHPQIGERHLKIGPHFACLHCAAYRPHSLSATVYYAIVPDDDAEALRLEALQGKYGKDQKKWPSDVKPRAPEHFVMLVKTHRFMQVDMSKQGMISRESSVAGMLVDNADAPDDDDKEQIRKQFPKINLDKTLILAEGRTPPSATTAFTVMSICAFLASLAFVGVMIGVVQAIRS